MHSTKNQIDGIAVLEILKIFRKISTKFEEFQWFYVDFSITSSGENFLILRKNISKFYKILCCNKKITDVFRSHECFSWICYQLLYLKGSFPII